MMLPKKHCFFIGIIKLLIGLFVSQNLVAENVLQIETSSLQLQAISQSSGVSGLLVSSKPKSGPEASNFSLALNRPSLTDRLPNNFQTTPVDESIWLKSPWMAQAGIAKQMPINSNNPDHQNSLVDLDSGTSGVTEIYTGNIKCASSSTVMLDFMLSNADPVTGFQFDLNLPSPMTFRSDTVQLVRSTDHKISFKQLENNTLHVHIFSPNNESFLDSVGKVLGLSFYIKGVTGFYQIGISNVIITNKSGENVASASYSGSLQITSPDIDAPLQLNFGDVSILSEETRFLRVNNLGQEPLLITGLLISDNYFESGQQLPLTVKAGSYFDLPVTFRKITKGAQTDMLTIVSNDPNEGQFFVQLSGNAVAPMYLRLADQTIAIGETKNIPVEIENDDPFVSFQFDLKYPSGLTPDFSSIALTDRKQDHTLEVTPLAENALRIHAFSAGQKTFSGNSGAVLNIPFKCETGTIPEKYPLEFSNITISNARSENILCSAKNGNLQVFQANHAPVANAGPDQTVDEGELAVLDGRASSDLDNNPLSYLWMVPKGITFLGSNATSQPLFWAPDVIADTTFSFSLVVNDGAVNSETDQVNVEVKHHNKAPVANAGPDKSVNETSLVTLDGTASYDPDNELLKKLGFQADQTITYEWSSPDNVTLSSATRAKPSFTAPLVSNSKKLRFGLKVSDGLLVSEPDSVFITVNNTNFSYHFKLVWSGNGYDHMNIYVTQFKLNGVDLEDGDEIAVFDGDFCVGVGNLSEDKNPPGIVRIIVSSKDNAGNGYVTDHPISYKFYDKSTDKEVDVCSINYANNDPRWDTDGKFTPGASAFVSLSCTIKVSQNIAMNAGWNIVSANVEPENSNLKDIFEPLIEEGKLKKVMDESGKVFENCGDFGGWQNNIGDFSIRKGYKVNVANASTLSVEGVPVQLPLDISLSAGWNFIAYPADSQEDAMSLLQTLVNEGKLKKVMDESGRTIENYGTFGGWRNNIGTFTPGKGYKVNAVEPCLLTISKTGTKSATTTPEILTSAHFKKAFTGNGSDHMNINLVDLLQGKFMSGDEIGIFDGEICVGSAQIGTDQLLTNQISIPASCNDGTDVLPNGFSPGNQIGIRLFRNNQEYLIIPDLLNNTKDIFEKNASMFARSNTSFATFTSELTVSNFIKCYPNPFSDQLILEIRDSDVGMLDVQIFDAGGRLIRNLYRGNTLNGKILVWDGKNDQGNKMVSGNYYLKANNTVKKIVLKN